MKATMETQENGLPQLRLLAETDEEKQMMETFCQAIDDQGGAVLGTVLDDEEGMAEGFSLAVLNDTDCLASQDLESPGSQESGSLESQEAKSLDSQESGSLESQEAKSQEFREFQREVLRPVPTHTCPRHFGEGYEGEDCDHWRQRDGFMVCSYCGSLQPDFVLSSIELGATVIPTDKSYKGYLRLPDGKEPKFYFQHFSEAERTRFVTLLNAKKMTVGYPGFFYVLPYFCVPAGQAEETQ